MAARKANLIAVPVIVYEGISDDDVVRLTDQDNENDEYHVKVPIMDVWADCHMLSEDAGWTQERIAKAKGWDRAMVTYRIGWHTALPKAAKKAVCDGLFDEGHCQAISTVMCDVTHFAPWLTSEQAQTELVAEVLGRHRGSSEGIKPSVKVVREAAARWKALFERAENIHQALPEGWQQQFVDALVKAKARTTAAVDGASLVIQKAIKVAAEKTASDAREQAEQSDKAAHKAEEEAAHLAHVQLFVALVQHGDARDLIMHAPDGFHLLLTDPPYGMDFQSGRRTTTAKKAKIAGDESSADAAELLRVVLEKALPKMSDDATVLVFTSWRNEPTFRSVLERAGLTIKGSLIWVKNNHGTGDLRYAFAPQHERILHAVKGAPLLTKRVSDVLQGKDNQNSTHPTEKPRDLLRVLIEATTSVGDIVVDPFAGSGNTLFEAHALGRKFWGCELDEAFARAIVDKLHTIANADEVTNA